MKSHLVAVMAVALLGPASEIQAELTPRSATVLVRAEKIDLKDALVDGTDLWVPADALESINGYTFKPEGICRGETCTGMGTKEGPWHQDRDGKTYVWLNAIARRLDQALAADAEHAVFALDDPPAEKKQTLAKGLAPDFAVANQEGKTVKLSDFRGKKVLVLTWASWCACSKDLPGWQKVYEELKDDGFEIIAAAQDTGGEEAARKFYDEAHATFTALVDTDHVVSSTFQMVNVPTGVWIDENGNIVRPPEVAYSKRLRILGQEIGDDEYAQGVRDWVKNGSRSPYVWATEKLNEKLEVRSSDERLADAEFKLGVHFYKEGLKEPARKHCAEAQRLNPKNWNYHRQDWTFNGSEAITKWLAKVRELKGKPYYDPVEFPGKEMTP